MTITQIGKLNKSRLLDLSWCTVEEDYTMISFEEDVHKLEQLYAFTIIKSTLEDCRNVFERKVYIRLEDNFDILKDSKPLDLRPG